MSAVNSTSATPVEVSQADFAKLRGVKPPLITRWKQRGLLVMSADGTMVRVEESNARLAATLHPGRGGDRTHAPRGTPASPTTDLSSGGYSVEAAREKRASAQLKELDLAERAKKLLDVDAVADATLRRVQAAKSALLALPRRVASRCALETDPAVIERFLLDEMKAVCTALATAGASAAAARDMERVA